MVKVTIGIMIKLHFLFQWAQLIIRSSYSVEQRILRLLIRTSVQFKLFQTLVAHSTNQFFRHKPPWFLIKIYIHVITNIDIILKPPWFISPRRPWKKVELVMKLFTDMHDVLQVLQQQCNSVSQAISLYIYAEDANILTQSTHE